LAIDGYSWQLLLLMAIQKNHSDVHESDRVLQLLSTSAAEDVINGLQGLPSCQLLWSIMKNYQQCSCQ